MYLFIHKTAFFWQCFKQLCNNLQNIFQILYDFQCHDLYTFLFYANYRVTTSPWPHDLYVSAVAEVLVWTDLKLLTPVAYYFFVILKQSKENLQHGKNYYNHTLSGASIFRQFYHHSIEIHFNVYQHNTTHSFEKKYEVSISN